MGLVHIKTLFLATWLNLVTIYRYCRLGSTWLISGMGVTYSHLQPPLYGLSICTRPFSECEGELGTQHCKVEYHIYDKTEGGECECLQANWKGEGKRNGLCRELFVTYGDLCEHGRKKHVWPAARRDL